MITANFILFVSLYLATAVTHGLLSRTLNKKATIGASKRAFISFLFGTLPVVLLISLFSEFSVSDTGLTVFYLALAGFGASLFHVLTMSSLKHMPASRWQVLNGSYVVFSALITSLFLGESLNIGSVAGITLTVAGIGLVAYQKKELASSDRKYDFMVLLASLAVSVALVFQSKATEYASNGVILLAMAIIQTVFLGIATRLGNKKDSGVSSRAHLVTFGILGALNGVLGLFYLLAQNNSDSIAVLTTSTSMSIPLSAIAAIIILKEQANVAVKLLGASLVFAGVVLFGLS